MISPETIAAAERIRRVTSGESPCDVYEQRPLFIDSRGRKIPSAETRHSMAVDNKVFAAWAMARLAADSAKQEERERPLDEAQFRKAGARDSQPCGCGCGGVELVLEVPGLALAWNYEDGRVMVRSARLDRITTVGHLLDLLAALGVERKGGVE